MADSCESTVEPAAAAEEAQAVRAERRPRVGEDEDDHPDHEEQDGARHRAEQELGAAVRPRPAEGLEKPSARPGPRDDRSPRVRRTAPRSRWSAAPSLRPTMRCPAGASAQNLPRIGGPHRSARLRVPNQKFLERRRRCRPGVAQVARDAAVRDGFVPEMNRKST
jgi:hypothetical protein